MSKLVSHYNQMFDENSIGLHMACINHDGVWSFINHMLTFRDDDCELVKNMYHIRYL